MNQRQARRLALTWLSYVCEEPEAFLDLEAWLGTEWTVEATADDLARVVEAFHQLRGDLRRRAGLGRLRGVDEAAP